VRQRASIEGDVVTLTAETADVLRVKMGDIVRVKT
jgi:arginine/ornithine N-succinyltransferase beta subunit